MTHFYDIHCHLFNILDVPAGLTARNYAGRLKWLGPAAPLLRMRRLLDNRRRIVEFFTTYVQTNLERLEDELNAAVPDSPKVITPLVMDFDEAFPAAARNAWAPTAVEGQIEQLLDGIAAWQDANRSSRLTVLPFLGFDPRKIVAPGGCAKFERLWQAFGAIGGAAGGHGPETLGDGQIIGLKLYPPMGFNPAARGPGGKLRYGALYEFCLRNGIPITAHCQLGSYSPKGNAGRELCANTTPQNWASVLGTGELEGLHLNLAHLGGESALVDSLARLDQGVAAGPPAQMVGAEPPDVVDCWPLCIMGLLLGYPNVYADLSAFDVTCPAACEALVQFVRWDNDGDLATRLRNVGVDCGQAEYRLRDKLLWGSDVPMVLDDPAYQKAGTSGYGCLLGWFCQRVAAPLGQGFYDAVTTANPRRFLFGS